jgi:tetratricopeptide (TPR) repeat protein
MLMLLIACLFLCAALVLRTWRVERLAGERTDVVSPRRGRSLPLEAAIAQAQARLRQNGADAAAYGELGLLLLQRVRITGDASDYLRASQALDAALAHDPIQVDALMGKGILALALHDFRGAMGWAEQARAVNPFRAELLGILVDAHVELGEYEQAEQTLQEMVNLRPGLDSYSRVAYLRELHGDVDGAIQAMEAAAAIAAPGSEPGLWAQVQLGNLYFNRGDLTTAETVYQAALARNPDYPYAQGGLARVRAAEGRTEEAIGHYRELLARVPLPEFAIALADLLEATGQRAAAQRQVELVRVMQALNAAAGMNVDLEMAYFDLEHGADMAQALAQAEAVYKERPTVLAADVLAWALYRNGRYGEARMVMDEALRLGTQDARFFYHAGMIALALGDHTVARDYLIQAFTINPYFSPLDGPKVAAMLASLASTETMPPLGRGPR